MKKLLMIIVITLVIAAYISYLQNKSSTTVVVSKKVIDSPDSPSSFKIMTYNIRHGVGLDGKLDLDRIASIIKDSGADIIGLNEVDKGMIRTNFKNQVEYLAGKLDMNYVFGPTVNRVIGSYGNAILTRFPIKEASNHILPGEPGSEKRGLLTAKILLPDHRYSYIIITHLSLNKRDRERQLNWIENYLVRLDNPFILMGDFNTELETGFAYKPLLQGVKTYPADKAKDEIDLYFSNLNYKLINGYTLASKASDHLPVVVELKVSA